VYLFDNLSDLLPCAVRKPDIVNAVQQVAVSIPTGRALPQKFFGGHIGIVVFVVCDFKDALIEKKK